jgi:hypothetical protein
LLSLLSYFDLSPATYIHVFLSLEDHFLSEVDSLSKYMHNVHSIGNAVFKKEFYLVFTGRQIPHPLLLYSLA